MPVDIAMLSELFEYDSDHGLLRWKERPRSHFQADHVWRRWNTRYSGKRAGNIDKKGYSKVSINDTSYRTHRVVWAMAYGCWPSKMIDHINHDTSDNRLCNLREADDAQNQHNSKAHRDGSVGYKGVDWNKANRNYRASITVRGKYHFLGVFKNPKEAHNAYCAAADRLHGEFANHGNTIAQIGRQQETY